jgi:DNA-binding LytR/AlgR family response regulator
VLFFISDEKYTRVQTASVEALIRKPIKELVDEIDPQQFWQIHRSTLVNVKAIAGVTRDFRGRQIVSVRATARSWKSAAATRTCSRACERPLPGPRGQGAALAQR